MILSSLTIFFGKLHPAIIHFPIALLSIAMLSEVASWMKIFQPISGYLEKASATNLILGALFVIPAVISGIIFASHIGFPPEARKILFLHRWAAITTMIVALITAGIRLQHGEKAKFFYRSLLTFTALLVLITGYLGGALVWEAY